MSHQETTQLKKPILAAADRERQQLKQLPAALRAHLRNANIRDNDIDSVRTKLQERLTSNVLSYLQLCIMKLSPNLSVNASDGWQAHDRRNQYMAVLNESVSRAHAS